MRATEIDTIEHYFRRAPSHSAPGGNVCSEVPGQILFSADAAGPLPYRDVRRPSPLGQKGNVVLRAVVSRVARKHSEHVRRRRRANFRSLPRRPPRPWVLVPRDIRCETRTPPPRRPSGADATAPAMWRGRARRSDSQRQAAASAGVPGRVPYGEEEGAGARPVVSERSRAQAVELLTLRCFVSRSRRSSSNPPETRCDSARRIRMARPRAGESPRSGTGAMVATRCRDRCSTTGADGVTAAATTVASIGIILAGSNAVTMAAALTAAIASSVPAGSCPASSAATSSTTAATSSTATALSQRRTYGQGNDSESEHEHTEDCHVACLPGWLIESRGSRVHLLTAPQSRVQYLVSMSHARSVNPSKSA